MCGGMFSFLALLLVSLCRAECPAEFEDLCHCDYVPHGLDRELTYITNCTNSGFDNALMLRKLPMNTEILIFTGNELKDLPMNILGQEISYEKLRTIDLSDNHIQTIKGRTFHNVGNVTNLILNDNDLYIVSKDHHPRMFSNFIHLKELHLRNAFTEKVKSAEYMNNLIEVFGNSSLKRLQVLNLEKNEISAINYDEFCLLPFLEELYLAENRLKELSLNFDCLKRLRVLDVSHNEITRLNDSTIQSLDYKRSLRLNMTGNPFVCDCDFVSTYEWMKTTPLHLVHREYYYCYDGYPASNIGQAVMALAVEDLLCAPKPNGYHQSASYIVMVVVLVSSAVITTAILFRKRAAITGFFRRKFQPSLSSSHSSSKFNYVSLERTETSMDL